MAGVAVSAIDVLVRVRHCGAVRIKPLAIVDSDDSAIVGVEAVSSEKCDGAALITDVGAGVETAWIGKPGVESAAQPEIGVGLEDDVDDAGHSIRVVLR